MSIEHVRLTKQAKDQLIRLKRRTGILNWNVLCRWAFCVSLAEPTPPPPMKKLPEGAVDMTWKVFGGTYHEIYLALLKERCKRDGHEINDEVLATQLRLHLYRGINYLIADRSSKGITSLLKRLPMAPNLTETGL